jgi:prophage antirepressor-like protein
MTIINESGLYSLILSSKLPQAKAFKRWVTSEVLPQIRKTGGYIPTRDEKGKELSPEEVLARNTVGSPLCTRQKKRSHTTCAAPP